MIAARVRTSLITCSALVLAVPVAVAVPTVTEAAAAPHATAPPVVTRLSATSGPTTGGTRVTVRGRHFTKVRSVRFGRTPGLRVRVRSATRLQVTAPAHAAGVVAVRIVTRHGTSKVVRAGRFRFRATDWVASTLPRPSDAAAAPTFHGAACWGDRQCVATGTYRQRSANDGAVLWTLAGTRWTAARAPVPADAATNAAPFPFQVACGAAGHCAAYAGYTTHRDGRDQDADLLWARSAGRWAATSAPVPADADPGTTGDIWAVTCAGAVCAARGTYDFGGNARPALWTLTGGTWSVASAPLPADAARVDLGSVEGLACGPAGDCAASGLYLANPGLVSRRVVWRLTGTGWEATALPAGPTYAQTVDFATACGSAVCLAAIDLTITGGRGTALWTLTGDAWTSTDLPLPAGAQAGTGHVAEMACPASGGCVAVGSYTDTAGDGRGALWTRSAAGTWSVTPTTLPSDAAQNPRVVVRRLACSAQGTCVATGSYVHHSGGSDVDDTAQYDRLQWTYAAGRWTLLARFGSNARAAADPALLSCGSDYCVRFDGYQTLWTLDGGRWRRFSPGVSAGLVGLADGGGVAFGHDTAFRPAAWVYVG